MADYTDTIIASRADPVLLALAEERDAAEAFRTALRALAQAGAFSEPPTPAEADWELYRLVDLEAAEEAASAALTQAERRVLTTKPVSLKGCVALLEFLRRYLSDDPEMPPSVALIVGAIGNVEATLRWALAASEQRVAC